MATIMEAAPAPWRLKLVPASFGGVRFHVEQQSRSSGRRVVLHEYPKRDKPYAEDMGQHGIRYHITGYLVGPSYHIDKKALISALEQSPGDALIDPYIGGRLICICERYSVTEVRERGGYCVFDMSFVEVGQAGNTITQTDTVGATQTQAQTVASGGADLLNTGGGIGHA
jgi:prophage DNA circulation protein